VAGFKRLPYLPESLFERHAFRPVVVEQSAVGVE
jgi:hypothetical protein